MLDFMQYEYIKTGYFKYGKSIRQLERETGHCRKSIRKVIKGILPRYTLTKERTSPVLGDFKDIISNWLELDLTINKKQRHTAVRIYHRLQEEYGYKGSESNLRKYVSKIKREIGLSNREVFIPLEQVFGEAEVDWGESTVNISGDKMKIKFFALRAQGSGAIFLKAYHSENLESFLDAHVSAFNFFVGVFKLIRYDNLKSAVLKILQGKERIEQEKFKQFHQYYSYEAVFCNSAKGNEKGGVEGIIGYSRRNFMVPIPEVESIDELNQILLDKCINYQKKVSGERSFRVEELLSEEQKHLIPLPKDSFPVWKLKTVKVDHYSTIRFDGNRYSVPTDYGYRDLELRISANMISIYDKYKLIAEHKRSYSSGEWVIEPCHYFKLISRKPGAFERAKPIKIILEDESFNIIYEKLVLRYGDKEGKKQFIEILLLSKKYSQADLKAAIEIVLEKDSVSFEMVKHIIDWVYHDERKTETLIFNSDSNLSDIVIPEPSIAHYELLTGG